MLIDSWNGFNKAVDTEEVHQRPITLHIIPSKLMTRTGSSHLPFSEGATGRIQPLDVFYNRQFKDMLRQVIHLINRRQPDYIVSIRKNLARLISIVHHQFTAERFRPMIQYAWYKSGYYSERPPPFKTPAQFCLRDYPADQDCDYCDKLCLIKCAHCEDHLCFDHWVAEKHEC
jgi:hypothetical protein